MTGLYQLIHEIVLEFWYLEIDEKNTHTQLVCIMNWTVKYWLSIYLLLKLCQWKKMQSIGNRWMSAVYIYISIFVFDGSLYRVLSMTVNSWHQLVWNKWIFDFLLGKICEYLYRKPSEWNFETFFSVCEANVVNIVEFYDKKENMSSENKTLKIIRNYRIN